MDETTIEILIVLISATAQFLGLIWYQAKIKEYLIPLWGMLAIGAFGGYAWFWFIRDLL